MSNDAWAAVEAEIDGLERQSKEDPKTAYGNHVRGDGPVKLRVRELKPRAAAIKARLDAFYTGA